MTNFKKKWKLLVCKDSDGLKGVREHEGITYIYRLTEIEHFSTKKMKKIIEKHIEEYEKNLKPKIITGTTIKGFYYIFPEEEMKWKKKGEKYQKEIEQSMWFDKIKKMNLIKK